MSNPELKNVEFWEELSRERFDSLKRKTMAMIPLTRVVDTLVIHIESEGSYVGKVLSAMRGKENIVWK